MPTAAEFEGMASQFVVARDLMHACATGIVTDADPTIMIGTEIEAVVELAVDESSGNAVSAAIACDALAELCRARAATCRQYTAAFAAYDGQMVSYAERGRALRPGEHLGSPPYPPRRPAAWAERG